MIAQSLLPRTSAVALLSRSLVLTALIRVVLAWLAPLTGDEAYFVQWGRELAGSYYDHGPMTGWWIWALLLLGDHPFILRLPAILAPFLVAGVIRRLLRKHDPERAALAATLYLWSPPGLLSIFITTDVPLLVFSMLAIAAASRANERDRPADYLLAGLFLGFAFLAKYFAVLLGLAFAVWWIGFRRPARPAAVAWLLLGVLPSAAQHVHWNYHHSWTNVMFNVLTRQEGDQFSLANPLLLLLMTLWLVGPAVLLLRRSRAGTTEGSPPAASATWRRAPFGLAIAAFLVPLAVFGIVSISQPVGLHWLLSFQPMFFAGLAAASSATALHGIVRPAVIYGAAHALLATLLLLIPLEWTRSHRSYPSLVLGLKPAEVLAALAAYRGEYRFSTPSYSKSALLEFHAKEPVIVLGSGSFHGRQDDLRTDFRELAGQNILVLTPKANQAEESLRWFRDADTVDVVVHGATFKVVLGRGFNYEAYRQEILQRVADRYYQMPAWLERISTGSFFHQRYDLARGPTATPTTSATP